ncbi:MAG: signal transduction histidine kinase [Glaciecola sp.]
MERIVPKIRFLPQYIVGQMMAVLGISFVLLLGTMAAFEFLEYDDVIDTAAGEFTGRRLKRIQTIIQSIPIKQVPSYLERVSHCHDGYALSDKPYGSSKPAREISAVARTLAERLVVESADLRVSNATLHANSFAYEKCAPQEMTFPITAIVVSLRLAPDTWLLAEVHEHEWHLTPNMTDWLLRSLTAFLVIGGIALIFVQRIIQPFKRLASAASTFASELEFTELQETGPLDVRQAIQSFNQMQRYVVDEMKRRSSTLAAISHDIRTPLTALRVKSELIEDEQLREDHIASIDKLEKITTSALDYLRGESRNEPMRQTDLGELVDSVCADFQEQGAAIEFDCPQGIYFRCRPHALVRALTNLLENALKYAGGAKVAIVTKHSLITIVVIDSGPGIPSDKISAALQPFERLSNVRDSGEGGFGLGLAIVKAVVEGHDGRLILLQNVPTGLVARMELPKVSEHCLIKRPLEATS